MDSTSSPYQLLELPQELQDMIFDLVFGRKGNILVVRSILGAPRSQGLIPSKLDDFIVSKKYFASASKIFVTSGPVEINNARGFNGLLDAYAKHVIIEDELFERYWQPSYFPELRRLKIMMSHKLNEQAKWVSKYSGQGMEKTRLCVKARAALRGLRAFEAAPDRSFVGSSSDTVRDEARARADDLEGLIRPSALQPRIQRIAGKKDEESRGRMALYPGSAVLLY